MKYSIAYLQRALHEYEKSAAWYRERSIQAAENFEAAIKEKISLLKTDPVRYRKTYKEFREVQLKKYPFNIIYLVNEKEKQVIIASVYHHKRNPESKYRKLK
ncbi:MAG TPA: type II toxin-antitoxin system RelE/ParE family toxin [Chitinophagaceae bacterium]|nr:type II toxin-antitoxin system RelE/ParE family toxin [Chitinophagaceae bacterium]